jgi:hypothetical protein
MTARFRPAYVETAYRVRIGARTITLRAGERQREADRALARFGVRWAVFITACNPASMLLPAAHNRRRMSHLRDLVRRGNLQFAPGEGRPDEAGWRPEPSMLVFGIPPRRAAWLGRRFGQNAVLCVRRGAAAHLLPLR